MATLPELAQLSAAVYGNAPVPTGWQVLQRSQPDSSGYLGVAYENTHTHEIVIANRGSQSAADYITDLEIAAGRPTADQTAA